jgi:hypothetical protein
LAVYLVAELAVYLVVMTVALLDDRKVEHLAVSMVAQLAVHWVDTKAAWKVEWSVAVTVG